MRAAVIQCGVKRADVTANLANTCAWISRAAKQQCRLAVLPECCLTGYVFDSRDELVAAALLMDGPEIGAVVAACRENHIYAVVGFFERAGVKVYNTAILVGPDGIVGAHRKNHLPYLGGDRFVDLPEAPGVSVFDTPIGMIGIAICYEIRFPEVVRTLMLAGAEIVVLPTNWPKESSILADHFTIVRAAENMVYFIAANRNDEEQGTRYLGYSQIVDPAGRMLACAGESTGLFVADLDLGRARTKKIVIEEGKFELNPISDRKPETFRV